jgi:hypothetical protein
MSMERAIAKLDWPGIGAQLDQEGFAILAGFLDEGQVRQLAENGDTQAAHHALAAEMRTGFYKHLVSVANRWNDVLNAPQRYPATLEEFLGRSRDRRVHGGPASTTRLREGEYQPLQQWTDGDRTFPLQLAALLSEPGRDFTGGEFVMTEQRPRMQSRPIVLPLRKGDVAIITTAKRPHKGTQGYYRVNLRHAVSRVHSGERVGWELLLHDAPPG